METLKKKLLGLLMLCLVPVGIALPGIPGDALLIGGLYNISPRVADKIRAIYRKYPLAIKSYAVISTSMVLGYWSWRIYENLFN